MIVISIDPDYGKGGQGCALVASDAGVLTHAWFERPGERDDSTPRINELHGVRKVLIEKPQQDSRSYAVPPSVLIELAWQGRGVAQMYATYYYAELVQLTPSEWKGGEAKPAQHGRLWRILSEEERMLLGGQHTEDAIFAALEKGARDRWRKPGGAYYPASFNTADKLDAAALNATYTGRLKRAR